MRRTIKSHLVVAWKSCGHIQILTASINKQREREGGWEEGGRERERQRQTDRQTDQMSS